MWSPSVSATNTLQLLAPRSIAAQVAAMLPFDSMRISVRQEHCTSGTARPPSGFGQRLQAARREFEGCSWAAAMPLPRAVPDVDSESVAPVARILAPAAP